MPPSPTSALPEVEARPAAAPPEDARPSGVATVVPRAKPSSEPPPLAQAEPETVPPHVAVVAVPASPVLSAHVRAPEPPAPSSEAAEQEELQPVRVHIGRLEVRASLEEQPRRPPEREQRPAAGLSLADYLRGERETA